MVMQRKRRLSREDWLHETLKVLQSRGIDGVKIVVIAGRLGVTSGSFYWHFKDLRDLLDCVLDYWERELTNVIRERAKSFSGPPEDRVLNLLLQVIEEDAAAYDNAISIWAREDLKARRVFERTLRTRLDFAHWMFKECGFSDKQARIRGRLMVAYLMGESATDPKSDKNWRSGIKETHKLLTSRSNQTSETNRESR